MPTPQDPLGLGDLPQQQPAQGGFGTRTVAPPSPAEEYRAAYAWTQATRSVPATAYEDRESYWKAKQEIERRNRERERQERLRQQQEQLRQQQLMDEIRARGPAFGTALKERLSGENLRPIAEWAGAQAEAQRDSQRRWAQENFPDIQPYTAPGMLQYNQPGNEEQRLQTQIFGRPLTPEEEVRVGWRAPGNPPIVSPITAAAAPFAAAGGAVGERVGGLVNAPDVGRTVGEFAGGAVPYVAAAAVAPEALPGLLALEGATTAAQSAGAYSAGEATGQQALTGIGLGLAEIVGAGLAARTAPPRAVIPERGRATLTGFKTAEELLAEAQAGGLSRATLTGTVPTAGGGRTGVALDVALENGTFRPTPTFVQNLQQQARQLGFEAEAAGLSPARLLANRFGRLLQGEAGQTRLTPFEGDEPLVMLARSAESLAELSDTPAGVAALAALNAAAAKNIPEYTPIKQPANIIKLFDDRLNQKLGRLPEPGTFKVPDHLESRPAQENVLRQVERIAKRNAESRTAYEDFGMAVLYAVRNREAAARVIGLNSMFDGDLPLAVKATTLWAEGKTPELVKVLKSSGLAPGRIPVVKAFLERPYDNSITKYPTVAGPLRAAHPQMWMDAVGMAPLPDRAIADAFGFSSRRVTMPYAERTWMAHALEIVAERLNQDPKGNGGWTGDRVAAAISVSRKILQFVQREEGFIKLPGSKPAPGTPAATPGAQPPPDPLDVVLQATTTEDLPKASFMKGVLDSTRGLREYFGTAARADRAVDRETRQGAQNILIRYAGQIQQSIPRESGIETRALRREAGAMTEKQRRSMYVALDDVDDGVRNRALNNLTTEQQIVYGALRMRIDAIAELLAARGIIDPDSKVANYFPHILDFADEGRRAMTGGGLRTPIKKPRNAIITGHRTQQTMADDILEGHRPLTLDPFKVYEHFLNEAKSRMVMADILDDIKTFDPQGVMYVKPGEMPPAGFSIIHHPMFEKTVPIIGSGGDPQIVHIRWAVRDNVAGYIKALVEPSAIRKNKAGRALLTGTSSIKRTVLGGPLDINFLGFMLKTAFYANGTNLRKFLPGALHTALMSQEAYDQFMFQEIGYAGQKMTRLDLYKRLDEAGLTGHGASSEVSRMMGDDPTPTLVNFIPIIGPWYERAQTFIEQRQFDRIIPTLKFEGTAELVESKLRTARGRAMSLEDLEREAANDMNTNMGGLNRIAQGRSKTSQDIAALLAIAPDWLESRLATGLGAFIPGAKNASNRRIMARWMISGAIATVIGSWIYGEERGWSDEQKLEYIKQNINPVKMDGKRPKINGHFMEYQMTGSGQWTSLLSFEKDLWRLVFGIGAGLSGDRGGFDLTAGGYLTGRFGVIPRLANDAIFQKNYSGQPITTNTGWAGVRDWLAYEATQTFVPSFASGVLQSQVPGYPGGSQSIQGALQNVTGLGRARTISATDTVDRAVQDEHIPKYDENGRQIGEYMSYRELPNDIAGEFAKRHPKEVQDVIDAREARGRDTFDDHRQQTLDGLAEWAQLAPTDYKAYREGVSEYAADQGIILQEKIREMEEDGISFSERPGDQGLLDGFFEAVAPATNIKSRKTDFDERDRLEDEYRATLTPYQNQRLDEMLGYSADPTYKQLKAEKKQIADSGYFDRYDAAWEEFSQHAEIKRTGATNPQEFEAWLKADLVRRGHAPELFNRHEYYGPWSDILEEYTNEILGKPENAEIDLLVLKLGYGQRVHSQKAANLYKERTGLNPPIPSN